MNVCYNLQMQNITFGIIGAIVAGLLVYFLTRNKKDNSSITDDKSLGLLLQQMNELTWRITKTCFGIASFPIYRDLTHNCRYYRTPNSTRRNKQTGCVFHRPTPELARYFKKSKTTWNTRRVLFRNTFEKRYAARILPDAISFY